MIDMKKTRIALICMMVWFIYSGTLVSCSSMGALPTPTATSIPTQAPTLTPKPTLTSTPTSTPTITHSSTPTPTSTSTSVTASDVLPQMQLNLKEGEVFHIRMVSDQEISTTVEGQKQEIIQKIGYGYTYTVTSVDAEGNVSIDIVYNWILLEQETDFGKVQFDSSNPPEEIPPEAEGYNALLGKGFSIRITPQGEILDIEGLDEMYMGMIDDLDITDETEREQMKQLFRDQFGNDALKEQMGNLMMDYPEGPIRVGDTWTQSVESTAIVPLIIETTYFLRSYENGIATIDARSTITTHPDAEMLDLGYAKIGYNLSGEQEGTTLLDVETGLTLNGTITQTLSGEMTMIMEDEEMTVPMSILGVTTIEMIMEE
jgi:hypothetical protein